MILFMMGLEKKNFKMTAYAVGRICWALLIIIFCSTSGVFGDTFYLKNGNEIKGDLLHEGDEYFEIQINVGKTRILKEQILKHEKESEDDLSVEQRYVRLKLKAKSVEDWMKACQFAKDNSLVKEEIFCLKRAFLVGERKDSALQDKIRILEIKYVKDKLTSVQKLVSEKKYTKAASICNETILDFPRAGNIGQVRDHRSKIYENLLSEEESILFLEKYIQLYAPFSLEPMSKGRSIYRFDPAKGGQVRSYGARRKRRKKGEELLSFDTLFQKYQTLDPVVTPVIPMVIDLARLRKFILKGFYHEYAVSGIYEKSELDQKRANQKIFNQAKSFNNNVWRGRKYCKKFNILMKQVLGRFKTLKKSAQREREKWLSKGYERVNGEWLSEKEAKIARGWVLYFGEWLDTKSSTFEAEKAKIDQKIKAEKEKQEKIKEAQDRKAQPLKTKLDKTKAKGASSSGELKEDELLARNPGKLISQVKQSIKKDVKQAVAIDKVKEVASGVTEKVVEKVSNAQTKKSGGKRNRDVKESPMPSKGLPIPLAVGLIAGIIILGKLFKKKN